MRSCHVLIAVSELILFVVDKNYVYIFLQAKTHSKLAGIYREIYKLGILTYKQLYKNGNADL
jgi:hypothetical protein